MEVHHHPHVEKKKFKEYFLEFLMIFLAVTLGFFAESLRENLVDRGKEKHLITSILADLKKDTADLSFGYPFQHWLLDKMDNALKIPVGKIRDIPTQDTFYKNFAIFYASYWVFVQNNNTVTQLKNGGGFSVFHHQNVIDSINATNNYYESWVKLNADTYLKSYEKTADLATQLIQLPVLPTVYDDTTFAAIPDHTEVFTQYNRILLEQLYSYIRYQKGALLFYIECEKEYGKEAIRLIQFLQKEYHFK
jgi:hypothetical protein